MRGTPGSTKGGRSLPGQREVFLLVTFIPMAGSSAEPKRDSSLGNCPPREQRWDEAPSTFAAPSPSRALAGGSLHLWHQGALPTRPWQGFGGEMGAGSWAAPPSPEA